MNRNFLQSEKHIAKYYKEISLREKVLVDARISFVLYFIGLGDDQSTAEDKVSQISDEVSGLLHSYVMGDTQPLIDGVNASSISHMDSAAKTELVGYLTL